MPEKQGTSAPTSKPKQATKAADVDAAEMKRQSSSDKQAGSILAAAKKTSQLPKGKQKVGLEAGEETTSLPKDSLGFGAKIKAWWVARKTWQKVLLWLLAIVVFILLVAGAFVAASYRHVESLERNAQVMRSEAGNAYALLKARDLAGTKASLDSLQSTFDAMKSSYASLGFWKYSPLAWHYGDGERVFAAGQAGLDSANIMVSAIEPYADVLGFGEGESIEGETAEDKIIRIVETLDLVGPKLDEVVQKLVYIDEQLAGINPKRYPVEIQGKEASVLIADVQDMLSTARETITNVRPLLDVLPDMAAVDDKKTYLVLFQNDGELRPTGGFMTAYSVMEVEKGKVRPIKSDDIYDLDDKFSERIERPEPIEKYLPLVYQWNLRDMNLSPDFVESMNTFIPYYEELPGEGPVDGVIAVDTQVLADLIEALGPVDVPGYGRFTSEIEPRCNCPQVIYALEDISTRPTPYFRSERKAVLGPLMREMLFKMYGAPKQMWPNLFQTLWKSIEEKHVLMYFFDETTQTAVEQVNLAGRIDRDFAGDYLHINNANFAGAKSNLFVTGEVEQELFVEGDVTRKVVTMTYKNPQPGDNCNLEAGELCLNGVLRSWIRVYVPLGSELVSTDGFVEDTVDVSEDLGKTVIEGFYTLAPESQVTLSVEYTVPYVPGETYDLLIQKQPGLGEPEYTVIYDGMRETFDLNKDVELSL